MPSTASMRTTRPDVGAGRLDGGGRASAAARALAHGVASPAVGSRRWPGSRRPLLALSRTLRTEPGPDRLSRSGYLLRDHDGASGPQWWPRSRAWQPRISSSSRRSTAFASTIPQEAVDLLLFLIVSLVCSNLASRLRKETEALRQREKEMHALYDFSRRLASCFTVADLISAIQQHFARRLRAPRDVLRDDGRRPL